VLLEGLYGGRVARGAGAAGGAEPDLGEAFLAFLMSREGQDALARKLRLPAVSA
jgi:ABC-type Fe3+ transport system substrate-binding protein